MDYRIEQLRYQLREDPASRVFYRLAEALRRGGETDEAIAELRRGLEHHPRYTAAWVALGRSLGDAGDAEGAGEAFGRALELDGSNLVAARALGHLAFDGGDWSAAIDAYRVVSAALPDDSEIADRIAEAEAAVAEETAQREALAAAPPAEVVRIVDDDPFADEMETEESIQFDDDVFGEMVVAEGLDEAEVSEGEVEEELASWDESEVVEPEEDAEAPFVEPDDGPMVQAVVDEDDRDTEVESWADVTDDDADVPAAQVSPPPVGEAREAVAEMVPEDGPVEAEPAPEVPEFDEPILEEGAPPAELEPESWSDLDEVVEPPVDPEPEPRSELDVEAGVRYPEADETGTDAAEPIIPETLADYDRPSEEPEVDEPEAAEVQPEDVPVPTLTLARLALQQGDEHLAKATLRNLVHRDPSNAEAAELLQSLESAREATGGGSTNAKVAALRGWLNTIRLASERQQQ